MAPPVVTLEPVAEGDKAVLANLVQLYRYDFSEVRGYELTEHGTFVYRFLDHYWTEPGRHAFFVRVDGRLAGFALARQIGDGHEVAEFFVARRHRRARVGRAAALALFARLPGRWTLFHDDANEPAARFWERMVAEASDGAFGRDQVTTSAGFAGVNYRFCSRPLSGGAPFIPLPEGLRTPDAPPGACSTVSPTSTTGPGPATPPTS
ncbi:MAG: GNAT family N-acetyltransferase [Actinomycetota bacterium]|nr:GNAT family N-acetyltransferase [Actinomycetota bacterium]